MASVNFAPIFNGWQGSDPSGVPLSGGLVNTYAAGTSTPTATYTDNSGGTANSNPIQLDAGGRPPAEIWLSAGRAYKFVLTDSLSNLLATYDNIAGIPYASSSVWSPSGLTPTYLSATQFSVVGDQTALFTVGLRIRYTLTSTLFYGTVTASSYGAGVTAVTVVVDATPLTSALNSVDVSQITTTNTPLPSGWLPAFTADRVTSDQSLPNGTTVIFNNVQFDVLSNYNATTGVFTAPSAGTYLATVNLTVVNNSGSGDILYIGMAGLTMSTPYTPTSTTAFLGGSVVISLNAGDTLRVSTQSAFTWTTVYRPNGGTNKGCFFSVAKLN